MKSTFTEDDRGSLETFLRIADKRAGEIDRECATLLLKVSNCCLLRHSKRVSAKEVHVHA